ncbi:MAG TPA: HAMP domain-containing sensor histidine kinase, partial [Flavobacteriales bacterium]|nr:HAMP domain-containing sensor histidine kinase [Flavobacteriales bacterium]
NRQFPDETEVSFAAIAKEVVEEFTDLAEHRSVALHFEASGDLVRSMDPALARTLVTNLLKNAILHNERGGSVTVQVEQDRLTVRNTGDKPLDAARIFTRFYKETTADGGTGLGLAIARAIAELYGMKLEYRFDGGHCFMLS